MSAFFPFIAAAIYGLGFVFMERAMQSVSAGTFMLVDALVGIALVSSLFLFRIESFSSEVLQNRQTMLYLLAGAAAPGIAWLITIYAVKNISAAYATAGEVSYPLFTVLFLFLIFGVRNFDWTVLVGAALIIAGALILLSGQVIQEKL